MSAHALRECGSWSFTLSEPAGPEGAPPGSSFSHDCSADLNAGDWMLMLDGITIPPTEV